MLARLAPLASLLLTGCIALDLAKTRESQNTLAEYAYVGGTVAAADARDGWLVVLIASAPCDEDWSALRDAAARGEDPAQSADPDLRAALARARQHLRLADHQVLQRPGRWFTRLAPGCYTVGAFEDLNRDGRYRDEPALAMLNPTRMLELAAGERVDALALVIPSEGRFAVDSIDPAAQQTRQLTVRSQDDQVFVSLDAVAVDGKVADLMDPAFGEASGKLGYYDVYTFAWTLGPGIYFLEPYDPHKIPVLFVHGAEGYPQQFSKLIAGLDRKRFQPWFFFYPSGAGLAAVAHFLSEQVERLEQRFGFEQMAVVAHSMGGSCRGPSFSSITRASIATAFACSCRSRRPGKASPPRDSASSARRWSSTRGATSRPTAPSCRVCSSRIRLRGRPGTCRPPSAIT